MPTLADAHISNLGYVWFPKQKYISLQALPAFKSKRGLIVPFCIVWLQ